MAERSGFDAWARHASPGLFRRARLLTPDWHAAQDLLQETLTQLFVKWDRVDLGNQPEAYARTTMFHLFVSRRRRRSSHELASDDLPELISPTADASARIDLARALADLKPTERAVIVARYVDDLPVADVARLVGRSEAWVRQTASRTLTRMRTSPHFAPAFQE
ncbi:sigma-70 family RNA polymerase sigma factor [Tessaracoccus massiliensis]|uniref:sigma-70 family RNA polymerase sigma factor n=1 Tax=Tessaracoccus massiliensis TaxID=1522311 RepID=UPI00059089B1|nr:sigma-70 family RNA polymerase sigma factor [Tessaracoccus massiliensis]